MDSTGCNDVPYDPFDDEVRQRVLDVDHRTGILPKSQALYSLMTSYDDGWNDGGDGALQQDNSDAIELHQDLKTSKDIEPSLDVESTSTDLVWEEAVKYPCNVAEDRPKTDNTKRQHDKSTTKKKTSKKSEKTDVSSRRSTKRHRRRTLSRSSSDREPMKGRSSTRDSRDRTRTKRLNHSNRKDKKSPKRRVSQTNLSSSSSTSSSDASQELNHRRHLICRSPKARDGKKSKSGSLVSIAVASVEPTTFEKRTRKSSDVRLDRSTAAADCCRMVSKPANRSATLHRKSPDVSGGKSKRHRRHVASNSSSDRSERSVQTRHHRHERPAYSRHLPHRSPSHHLTFDQKKSYRYRSPIAAIATLGRSPEPHNHNMKPSFSQIPQDKPFATSDRFAASTPYRSLLTGCYPSISQPSSVIVDCSRHRDGFPNSKTPSYEYRNQLRSSDYYYSVPRRRSPAIQPHLVSYGRGTRHIKSFEHCRYPPMTSSAENNLRYSDDRYCPRDRYLPQRAPLPSNRREARSRGDKSNSALINIIPTDIHGAHHHDDEQTTWPDNDCKPTNDQDMRRTTSDVSQMPTSPFHLSAADVSGPESLHDSALAPNISNFSDYLLEEMLQEEERLLMEMEDGQKQSDPSEPVASIAQDTLFELCEVVDAIHYLLSVSSDLADENAVLDETSEQIYPYNDETTTSKATVCSWLESIQENLLDIHEDQPHSSDIEHEPHSELNDSTGSQRSLPLDRRISILLDEQEKRRLEELNARRQKQIDSWIEMGEKLDPDRAEVNNDATDIDVFLKQILKGGRDLGNEPRKHEPGDDEPYDPEKEFDSAEASGDREMEDSCEQLEADEKIDDELPSSARQLKRLDNYHEKLQRMNEIAEIAKQCIKPIYRDKKIDKNQYKNILKRTVDKVMRSGGQIDNAKIFRLVSRYVDRK